MWRSGRQPLEDPGGTGAAVPQPVVQPVRPALPELHLLGNHQVTTPEWRIGHGAALRPACGETLVAVVELGARPQQRGLPARPRADLRSIRPRMEVTLVLRLAEFGDGSLDDHLAAHRMPREQQAGTRGGGQFAGLTRG